MNRIDALIKNPGVYYSPDRVEGYIQFCENELTLTDGSDMHLLDSFKLWAEQLYGWYYFVDRSIWEPYTDRFGGHFVTRRICKRLINKQYLILGRGGSKSCYLSSIQGYELNCNPATTHQITTAPTMRQADEVLSPLRTAITRARGPMFQFLTEGSLQNTTGSKANRVKLASTKKGIENFLTGSLLEIRPMSMDKLQGLRGPYNSVDEWLSSDIKEDVVGTLEQGASKNDDWWLVCVSSEGTVRNGPGDTIKMELESILKGEYYNPHVSIWWYNLDDVKEVGNPAMWIKANPNLGKTVTYETYQTEVERSEKAPATRNDMLAKRFGIATEGFTYFFAYEETIPHRPQTFWQMPCAMGMDASMGDDFFSFTFLFPLGNDRFGVKTRCYITSLTFMRLPPASRQKYEEFLHEGSLIVMEDVVLRPLDIYDDIDKFIQDQQYDVRAFGYDPYQAKEFVERWSLENGGYNVEKVIQGARTESVPLGELKILARERMLLFDQSIMQFTMGNCVAVVDTNGNKKLMKRKYENKIDCVAALLDAYVAYKLHADDYE